MSESVTIAANAKLNLSLDITGRGPNGYHTLETVMQSVDITDLLTVHRTGNGITVSCTHEPLSGEQNIVHKAAEAFFDYCKITERNVKIKIKKEIPLAAGLGGGSADAAATLVALRELYMPELDNDELCEIAITVGADVPFCIEGGTQFAEGIGGILTPLPELSGCCFAIVSCGVKGSTAEMYSRYDAADPAVITRPDTQRMIDCICRGESLQATTYLGNAFECLYGEELQLLKRQLTEQGALGAALSGSGPSVFGVFDSEETARHCKAALEADGVEVILCCPVDCGCERR